jgi:hypothetical protein
VQVFEVNTLGQVLVHEGRFHRPDSLVLDRRSGGRVVQRSVLVWRGPLLTFVAESRAGDGKASTERMTFRRSAR